MVDNLDNFTRAYIAAAMFTTYTSIDASVDDAECEPLDVNYDVSDIAPETLARMADDCARFQREQSALLDAAASLGSYARAMPRGAIDTRGDGWETVDSLAGHDFWLTRCGHGAGFWDRGLGDVGDQLTAAAKAFGGADLYVGDDGRIHA